MTGHIPVMLEEVVQALAPRDDTIYVDGTFGRGGYTEAILNAAANKVFGVDRDPAAITFGAELSSRFPGRLELLEGRFGDGEIHYMDLVDELGKTCLHFMATAKASDSAQKTNLNVTWSS